MTKGTRLEMIRVYLKLNQKQMSEKLGLQQSQYSKLENDRSGFSDETISFLADMGFNVHWLFTGNGEMFLTPKESAPTDFVSLEADPELMKEMEERVRRIRLDVSDIEDTLRKMLSRKK